jgi:hypothetical protein
MRLTPACLAANNARDIGLRRGPRARVVLDIDARRGLAFEDLNHREVKVYEGLKVLHVLAAVLWVGGAFTLQSSPLGQACRSRTRC